MTLDGPIGRVEDPIRDIKPQVLADFVGLAHFDEVLVGVFVLDLVDGHFDEAVLHFLLVATFFDLHLEDVAHFAFGAEGTVFLVSGFSVHAAGSAV